MATAGAVSMAAEPGDSLEGGRLAQRLGEIAASAAPEDMLEPALRAIVSESGAAAGALCFFDSRQDLLRLAAEVGLSDEGCRQLRAVRRGAATGWDIPLHGLLNRRAYLIDSAAQNRYVPPLVEPPGSMRAVVCIPLHAGPSPLGSLILVAVAPRTFVERDIHALEAPLGVLIKMIQATRRRGGEQTSPPAAVPPPAPARSRRWLRRNANGPALLPLWRLPLLSARSRRAARRRSRRAPPSRPPRSSA
ncbi:MAG: GAF domain-containing protein [Deltaproteobacteria bacterium]|nr:MAG: GAF domain-containing protein [Deltaproteobacteria bacterium]